MKGRYESSLHDVAGIDDRRRHVGDPAEHHRDARPRASARLELATQSDQDDRVSQAPRRRRHGLSRTRPKRQHFARRCAASSTQRRRSPSRDESAQEALVSGWQANQEWFQKLGKKGWIAPAWPKEYGGASMTTVQQFIFNEEMALQQGAAADAHDHRARHGGPDAHRARHRRPEAEVPARHAQGRGHLVPGLQRAGRRLRPGVAADARRARRRRLRRSTARRSGRRWPTWRST